MPEYMLLLYAPEVDEAERAERWAELARYGSVEVRPILSGDEIPRPDGSAARLELS